MTSQITDDPWVSEIAGCIHCFIFGQYLIVTNAPYIRHKYYYNLTNYHNLLQLLFNSISLQGYAIFHLVALWLTVRIEPCLIYSRIFQVDFLFI